MSEAWQLRPGSGLLRLVRVACTSAPALGVTVAAHAGGGGCLTSTGIAATAAVIGLASWQQLSRERSTAFFIGWTALCQVLAHGLLGLTCGGPEHPAHVIGTSTVVLLHGSAAVVVGVLAGAGERRLWAWTRLLRSLRDAVSAAAAAFRTDVVLRPMPTLLPARSSCVASLRTQEWTWGAWTVRGPPGVPTA